jgi:hypothetical protein
MSKYPTWFHIAKLALLDGATFIDVIELLELREEREI